MTDLRFLWPILLTATMLGARIWELRRKFEVEPGKVVETRSFKLLVAFGVASVLLCSGYYLVRGEPPRYPWLSAAGALLGVYTFVLRGQARKALDRMFSLHVDIREHHTLVQTGPYRRIRHPIYLGTILEVIAAAFLLNAWIPGIIGLVVMTIVLRRRIRIEEQAMEEKFGEAWRQYRLRTGLLWPRL
jgi:protein-S-isoprenylcysteine O-methyltransferase Ste14